MAKVNESKIDIESFENFCGYRDEYNPNVIHNKGMSKIPIFDDTYQQYTEPTVTDQESYRITLASMRGMISRLGSNNVGSYSLKDGKYNPDFDFSYLNRKDLTIVDIQNFINNYKASIESYDEDLKQRIKIELDKADQLLKENQKETVEKTQSKSE